MNYYNLKWTDGSIHILGKTEIESIKYSFEPRIKTIRTIFNMWKKNSLKGNVTVINNLAASLLVNPCTALDTPEIE